MDTELCTLRSRFINVYDTDELKSKLQDILPFDKKGYKIISVLGSLKKFQGFVECSVLDTPEGFKEFVESMGEKMTKQTVCSPRSPLKLRMCITNPYTFDVITVHVIRRP